MNPTASGKPSWATRILLGLLCLTTLPYGLQCLADPKAVADMAGVLAGGANAATELRAAYGGFQIAAAVLCGVAVFRPVLQSGALLFTVIWLGGSAVGRAYGVAVAGEANGYIQFALAYETVGTAWAAWLLLRRPAA